MKMAREPNIGVKSSQNGPQMVPKWAQDGSKIVLNWVKNRSKFEIFPNWGQRHDFRQIIDDFGPPKGAQMSPKIDLLFTCFGGDCRLRFWSDLEAFLGEDTHHFVDFTT